MTTSNGVIVESASAKINLSLHVTGQRSDGYHLLDSLVMFTDIGDRITVEPSDTVTLNIVGPFADGLSSREDNLVLRAARSFDTAKGAAITLVKNLPVASGIGGGSADAAATLRALSRLWDLPIPDANTQLKLGADVPVCMTTHLTRMRGIGDQIEVFDTTPVLHILLINPNIGVSTATVFNGLESKTNAPMRDLMPNASTPAWIDWLAQQRNDLEGPARVAAPVISDVLTKLVALSGCVLARMSGSGATCFAIFKDAQSRDDAGTSLRRSHPDWWVAPTTQATI